MAGLSSFGLNSTEGRLTLRSCGRAIGGAPYFAIVRARHTARR